AAGRLQRPTEVEGVRPQRQITHAECLREYLAVRPVLVQADQLVRRARADPIDPVVVDHDVTARRTPTGGRTRVQGLRLAASLLADAACTAVVAAATMVRVGHQILLAAVAGDPVAVGKSRLARGHDAVAVRARGAPVRGLVAVVTARAAVFNPGGERIAVRQIGRTAEAMVRGAIGESGLARE